MPPMRVPLVMVCLMSPAFAGNPAEADRLVAEGVAKGEAGDYPGAIEYFMAAERAFPRPVHDCNIGLAWIGLKQPATAFFFIDRCQQRAKDALPSWVATQHAALRQTLTGEGFARLSLHSTPPGAAVEISALKGAEPRTPITLYVPHGSVTVTARLDGFETAQRTLEIADATQVTLALKRPVAFAPPTTAPPSAAPPSAAPPTAPPTTVPTSVASAPPSKGDALAWTLAGVGVASAAAGVFFLSTALDEADAADSASRRGDRTALDDARDATRLNEGLAYGSFALALGLGVTAGLLFVDDDDAVSLVPHGAGLGLRVRLP